jgi:rubredoxin
MAKWECQACGFVYDEDDEGTKFEDLPEDYTCPVCGVVSRGTPILA